MKNTVSKVNKSGHTEKLATLGMLSSGIAHDFNNLLVSILGNADIALLKIPPESPVYHIVENIKKASLKASGLTNQMLSYSGKGNLFTEPVDINLLIDEMAQILKISIPNNITLKYNYAENLPPVEADPTQIHQIVMNLITNASEAIGDADGAITIKTGICDTRNEKSSDSTTSVCIEISDTGPGIDDDVRKKIFDPFYTTKPTGRGLGLSVVHENVLGHNGTLNVESGPEQGTVFTVSLPASGKPLREAETASESSDELLAGGATMLVIDDDRDVLEVIVTMLETADITVQTFSGGRKAVEYFKSNADSVDIVLLDLTMPNMSGEEVFRALREIKPDVPVILTSGYGQYDIERHFEEIAELGELSDSDFIRKPYQIHTLIRKINSRLRGTNTKIKHNKGSM
jgi:two-component system, cell cycle sensor histidine kinase and response regulator CckA